MQEHLPPELQEMVKELIDTGTYHNFEEIVHDALWLARDRFPLYKVKREELLALLDVGIKQAERGEVAPLDMEAIKAKAALRLQQEQEQDASLCRK
jgi:Arc/MetJ-type ribon-helix-helix transcriptional regulator